MKQRARFILVSVLLFASLFGSFAAQADATYGAEFNFTNYTVQNGQSDGHTVNSDASEAARDAMMKAVSLSCTECRITSDENSYGVKVYQVNYPDGWYFRIATDPKVVEVQTKASTAAELEGYKARIQKDIFRTAASATLAPATHIMGTQWAGSHVHVGLVSAVGTGPQAVRALRNFMVDFSNHGELASGIFSADSNNAPALAELPELQRSRFQQIINDVDSGKIRSANTFAKRVRKEVYDVTLSATASPTTKYHAFNVNRIGDPHFALDEQTFELRAMRGQESAEDFIILTRLIEARLRFVANQPPIALDLKHNYYSDEERAERFYRYVTETGLSFGPYEKFLTYGQTQILLRFKSGQPGLMCRDLFATSAL